MKHVYGPVPSARLGKSLGIDLVPLKTCSYDCIYCQLGHTTKKKVQRKEYVRIEDVFDEVNRRLASGLQPDYITFAGSGEPTLNARIGELIREIKCLTKIPVAVLTNGSLLWDPEVQEDLSKADVVLPSLDAGDARLFQKVNRPCAGITFEKMVRGLIDFTRGFPGSVWLEVFLLKGLTGIPIQVEKIAEWVERIGPQRVQLNTLSRPPAEENLLPVSHEEMERFRGFFSGATEVIGSSESEEETSSSNQPKDEQILALLSRQPCTVQGIASGLGLNASDVVKRLRVLLGRRIVRSIRKEREVFYRTVKTPRSKNSKRPVVFR